MSKEPLARGVVLALPQRHAQEIAALQKESLGIVRAIDAEGTASREIPSEADFVALLIEAESPIDALAIPDLKDRAATVVAVGDDAPACRAAIARARRELRARGAALGARELVLPTGAFGVLGLESDGSRERLEILLRTLVNDAERLRLRREGWEEPEARDL